MWRFNAKGRVLHWDNYRFCQSDLQGSKCVCSAAFVYVRKCWCGRESISKSTVRVRERREDEQNVCPNRKSLLVVRASEVLARPVIFIKPFVTLRNHHCLSPCHSPEDVFSQPSVWHWCPWSAGLILYSIMMLFMFSFFIPAVCIWHKVQWDSSQTLCSYIT